MMTIFAGLSLVAQRIEATIRRYAHLAAGLLCFVAGLLIGGWL
jgi:hypothetical protein